MAIDPTTTNPVPAITQLADYREEMFAKQYVEGAPSFYDYLENMRKVPRTHFSDLAWDVLTLNSEMMAYNVMLRGIVERRVYDEKVRQAQAAQDEQLSTASLEDLMASEVHLNNMLENVHKEMAKASMELVKKGEATVTA